MEESPDTCVLVYRGPLERSRVAFLLRAVSRQHRKICFVWIFPGRVTSRTRENFKDFSADFSHVQWHILNHKWADFFDTKQALKRIVRVNRVSHLVLIGGSAALFSRVFQANRITWCINGVPEERQLDGGRLGGFLARAEWWLYKMAVRPDEVITVSTRMARYVSRFFPNVRMFAAPTCADRALFVSHKPEIRQRGLFCYLGTGAPWQALGKLSLLWQEIARQDPAIRFRVISRDPRSRVLADGLDAGRIEFVQSDKFHEVAEFLHGCEAGFLIREDHIINRVSFPTKVAEYLAAGCWVVISDLDWDASDYVREHACGYLVEDGNDVELSAGSILNFQRFAGNRVADSVRVAANELDTRVWIDKLADFLFSKQTP